MINGNNNDRIMKEKEMKRILPSDLYEKVMEYKPIQINNLT